jgi:hypothetical protein
MVALHKLAKEITSKNAGIAALTLDIVFHDQESYERVKEANIFTRSQIAALYHCPEEDVLHIVQFDQGRAFKIALRRTRTSGDVGETDLFGAQQYAPLLYLNVP